MNGFSGKDSRKIEPVELLPFEPKGQDRRKLSKDTKHILKRALEQELLPPVFWGAISHLIEEIRA